MLRKLTFALSVLLLGCSSKKSVRITIDTREPIQVINPLSPSVAMGIGIFLYKWVDYFKDPRFLTLAKGFGPSFLRVGGTRADFVTFQPGQIRQRWRKDVKTFERAPETSRCQSVVTNAREFRRHRIWAEEQENLFDEVKRKHGVRNVLKPVNVTGDQWIKLNEFSECVGWNLIYGLNMLKRNGSKWDSRNAEELLDFTRNHRYHVNWELGNEPNSYPHKTGYTLTPEQLADGFIDLQTILNESSWWDRSLIIGPDINRIEDQGTNTFLSRFLNVAGNVVDSITFHQYYFGKKSAKESNYLNPGIANSIAKEIIALKTTVNNSPSRSKKLWLGETSSAYGGGAWGFSNTFLDGFLWLDKLGITSKLGVDLVFRQGFFEHAYGLVDGNFNPRPDYWLTMLYRRLVGNRVLNVTLQKCIDSYCSTTNQRYVRIYSHCAKHEGSIYEPGSVVMTFINMKNNSVRLFMEPINGKSSLMADLYLLETGTPGNLTVENILLNGRLIELTEDHMIPELPPKRIRYNISTKGIRIPLRSYGFIVFRNANAPACLS